MKNKAAAFHPFAYLAAFGISGAMGGMLMCVNTLLMLDRGLSLAQVALGLSLFSITQVLLEVPSGMLGDLYGRKRIWMAAMLVRLCYLPLFLFASGPILLAGYVGNGAANALNSGTLDAMYLENWLHARGKKTLARGTALQQAVQYGSQAAGALLGGGLSTLKFFRPYSVNILACTALCVTGLLVAVFAIPADGVARRGTFSPRGIAAGFCAQAGQTVRLAKASPLVLLCLLSVLPYGFAGIGIEAYWQPRLLELLNGAQPGILLGVFSCTAMGGVTASGFLAGKLVRRANTTRRRVALFLAIRAALTALLAALAIVLSVPVYLALYITYYLTLGMYACVDSVLVQSETPDEVRGTVMSAQSLLQMVGAWLGTGAAGLWLGHGSIPGLWLLCAAVLAGGTAACLVPVWLLRRAKCRAKPLQNV